MVSASLDVSAINAAIEKETEVIEKCNIKYQQWSKTVIFDDKANIITQKNCATTSTELKEFLKAYESRDNTIGAGFILLNEHYDVHRFHPPLIYGRKGDADVGEGISLCRGKAKANGQTIYMIICYELPIISARAVPQQINFFNFIIGELEKF